MTEEPLTFNELRKIQKKERRNDNLAELDQNFIIDASEYLNRKKDLGESNREYKNAKRVIDKIVSIREDKIFKQAKIAVKSEVNPENLNLLPREEKLFRKLKENFENHRKEINEHLKTKKKQSTTSTEPSQNKEIENQKESEKTETPDEEEENSEKSEQNQEEIEEGYQKIKITTEVPEFMGTDLEPYGPFEAGEKVKVPEENAEILINRGNAEEI